MASRVKRKTKALDNVAGTCQKVTVFPLFSPGSKNLVSGDGSNRHNCNDLRFPVPCTNFLVEGNGFLKGINEGGEVNRGAKSL